MAVVLCLTLVACAEGDTGHRFANEPTPTGGADLTSTIRSVPLASETPSAPLGSPVPLARLLGSPGGLSTIVVQVGADLVAISPPWTQPRPIWSGARGRVLAFDLAPGAGLVAILVAPGKPADRVDLVVVDLNGEQVRDIANLQQLTGGTTKDAKGSYSLRWSPDGSQVLAGFGTGGILGIPRDGNPRLLVSPARAAAPGQLSWSPHGDAVAFVNPVSPKSAGGLYVARAGAVPLDPVALIPPSADGRRTVSRASWSPDGVSLLFTLASTVGDPTFGGDLFEVPAAGGAPRLVATASRVGPVSAITDFVVSPDGRGVAYVVTVPDDKGNPVDSLLLQPIGGAETLRLSVGNGERVAAIWWTTDGLIWRVSPASGDAKLVLYRARSGEAPALVFSGPVPAATPIASPVATTAASPIPSPGAGSPVAAG